MQGRNQLFQVWQSLALDDARVARCPLLSVRVGKTAIPLRIQEHNLKAFLFYWIDCDKGFHGFLFLLSAGLGFSFGRLHEAYMRHERKPKA